MWTLCPPTGVGRGCGIPVSRCDGLGLPNRISRLYSEDESFPGQLGRRPQTLADRRHYVTRVWTVLQLPLGAALRTFSHSVRNKISELYDFRIVCPGNLLINV